ncbi:MAG: hypothetical protein EAZ60_15020 [Oscillatoriales cyanobacterium]|nr:MAG: hypothetical protein EAZ94_04575 [Oscillatoriales cyanobacterium]TAE26568.1 MAG: hypothetical protein EAZ93_07840 [Oscillatoriales cyanobacterium]TAE36771.1 MAG: hypothetical protein EAZ90_27845 [Oscillatoriales cyanobacterium]TAE52455.1 MAG: hypothetical protein EAZ88_15115 [Oscillatoriales cyanobacterium]TAE70759.1 MAG: hypothetical protein EAZ86_05620 [Oscillatoriales cyanobacterium]
MGTIYPKALLKNDPPKNRYLLADNFEGRDRNFRLKFKLPDSSGTVNLKSTIYNRLTAGIMFSIFKNYK